MLLSLAPIALLVLLLSASVALFGSDASYGPNQVALIIASAATMLVGWHRGMSWQAIQDGMVGAIIVSIMPMMILLSVGALIGSWIISGTVPGMIYYGVQLLDPGFFYAASAVICALASLSLGSSWTVAGTLGIGLMGIATTYSLSPAITAGAVISGAYFGDKLSPLSDTTNLAAAAVGVDLFEHIKNMLWTTLPAFIAALVIFSFIGSEGAATPRQHRRDPHGSGQPVRHLSLGALTTGADAGADLFPNTRLPRHSDLRPLGHTLCRCVSN